ncbi:hypothetical protein EVAR_62784_1 [Eumeta japonica]|uniref:Uncharacterized protein n=1 Tax=Eumeta variegata TaxID=151549 RepID=A0A4C1Z4F7_EUMVA|nr:hypothetical protein EVAR_62784_1 [Eumeta japonica]
MDNCLYDYEEYKRGLRMVELFVKCLLCADHQVVHTPSACELLRTVKPSGGWLGAAGAPPPSQHFHNNAKGLTSQETRMHTSSS